VWFDYDPGGLFGEPAAPLPPLVQALIFGAALAGLLYQLRTLLSRRRRAP
jgi:hypothetical protein